MHVILYKRCRRHQPEPKSSVIATPAEATKLSLRREISKDLCCVAFGTLSGRVTQQLHVPQLYTWQSWAFSIPVQTSCHSCASHCPTWQRGLQILGHERCQIVLKPKIPSPTDLGGLRCLRWRVIIQDWRPCSQGCSLPVRESSPTLFNFIFRL